MPDVVDGILDVHTANLLLQRSSTKGQSLAEGGVAKHIRQGWVEVGFYPAATLVPLSRLDNTQLIHNNLYSTTGAIIQS